MLQVVSTFKKGEANIDWLQQKQAYLLNKYYAPLFIVPRKLFSD